jgi:threonine dehydrogenase-like Zn-dependent dehydrogenase
VPGDKFAGTVIALGRDVAGLTVGDMVVGVPILRCGRCPNCMESGACSEPLKLGVDVDGSHVQFIKLPDENVLRIPRGRISLDSRPDAACLAEALAIAEHAVTKSTVFSKKGIMDYQLRKPILVLGTNLVALNILQRLLEGYSDVIIVLDHSEERLSRLKGLPDAQELLGRRIYPVLVSSVGEAVSKVLELAGRPVRMIFNALGTRRSVEIAYRVMDIYAVLVNVSYSMEELGGLHQLIEGKKVTIYDCAMVPFDELRSYMEMALISMSYSRIEPWRFKAMRPAIDEAPPILDRISSGDRGMMGISQVTIKPNG